MPRFHYLALRTDGQEIDGFVDAPSEGAVSSRLREDDLLPIEIAEQGSGQGWLDELRQHLPVTVDDISLFCSQFALMLRTGLPILSCLELLAENSPKLRLQKALHSVRAHIEDGGSLAEGLAATRQFPDVFVNMVASGETGGHLDDVLAQLSVYLAREAELRGRVNKALAYPAFLVMLSIGVTTFLLIAIIPRFAKVLDNLGVDLPVPTQILMATSTFMVGHWIWLLGGLIGAIAGSVLLLRDEAARRALDGFLLKVPLLGELLTKNALARFAYVLGSLLRGGIPIVEALTVAKDTAGNRALAEAIGKARQELVGGRNITDALAMTGAMPALVVQMVSIGESSGTIDQVLSRLAEIYDQQVDRVTSTLVSLLEPALIVVLGGVVGFIALSLVLPMVRATSAIGG